MFTPRQSKPGKPARFCENPECGAKLNDKDKKYCDRICFDEHQQILKRERRPKELHCSACGADIDVMAREAARLTREGPYFCDSVCADKFRRENGQYTQMAEKGREVARAYHDKHGKRYNHEERSEATTQNNIQAPPKAKYFVRTGKIWGYQARALPDGEDGYRLLISEHPELGIVRASTFKACMLLMRQRIVDSRGNPPAQIEDDSPLAALPESEFEVLFNAFNAGSLHQHLPGYQAVAGHYSDHETLAHAIDVEFVRRYTDK